MNLALAFTHPLTSGSQCNYSSTQRPDTVYKGVIKNNLLVCENCGQVHDYLTANEYIDSYEYRHRIKRKSVYHRKYHIINVMDNIAQMNNIQIGYYNTENILRIFQLIDNVTHQPGVCRKRLISVNFIIKQLFHILGIEYKIILLTRIKNTLLYRLVGQSLWSYQDRCRSVDFSEFRQEVEGKPLTGNRFYSLSERPWGRGFCLKLSSILFYSFC